MFYRVVETGYRLTKFGRHAASCALQGLACGGLVVSAGALGRSLSGLGNSSGRAALLAGGAALMMVSPQGLRADTSSPDTGTLPAAIATGTTFVVPSAPTFASTLTVENGNGTTPGYFVTAAGSAGRVAKLVEI